MADPLRPPHLRLLTVTHSSAPSGAELAMVRLLPRLRRYGVEAQLCLGRDGVIAAMAREHDVAVHVLDVAGTLLDRRRDAVRAVDALRLAPALLRAAGGVAALCSREHIDLVHACSMKAFAYGSLGARLAGRPLVWEVHDIPAPPYLSESAARVFRAMAALARPRAVMVHSRAVARALPRVHGVAVVPLGVPAARRVPLLRTGPLRLGMAARLTEWKGQRVAIAAMERVTNEIPDAQLLLAGAALFGEDDYVRSLQEEIEARGLSENVHLVGHVADPTSFYRGVDIALHTSVMPEPFGLSIVDAMVAGRPVVAAAGGAVHEILGGQSGGVVVEPSDPTALARGILDLAATGPAGLQLRGDLARRRARVYDIRRSALLTARFFHGCSPPIQDG